MFPECQHVIDALSKRLPSNVTCATCYSAARRFPSADRHYTVVLKNRSGCDMKITRLFFSDISHNFISDAFLWLYLNRKFVEC